MHNSARSHRSISRLIPAPPPMPRPASREIARQRETRAWAMRQACATQDAIAQELGVSQPAVSQILARVEKRVLADLRAEVERCKVRQTAQLEHVACEAILAW